ncbi:hypothetical protein K469DRAFT_285616 [Zopfia rhizophila CBS 207.26]|uniref:Uncharacterized protein n=1 Tax=Zopfia rhizophila CBS 207.26 TaxID=1314779 RepID=A0A6A6ESU8_9PEZI|nr:hypothetical protein K469DRAFT_285616 [Zopfia rhizophila CBS 207.26]
MTLPVAPSDDDSSCNTIPIHYHQFQPSNNHHYCQSVANAIFSSLYTMRQAEEESSCTIQEHQNTRFRTGISGPTCRKRSPPFDVAPPKRHNATLNLFSIAPSRTIPTFHDAMDVY